MKKSNSLLLLAVAAVTALSSCTENAIVGDDDVIKNSKTIGFGIALPQNTTRASLTSFSTGDKMAVFGFQDTNLLFNDQLVENTGATTWQYSPLKYWQTGSDYDFYAFYPYGQTHSFDQTGKLFTVTDFVVADAKDAQVDVMIAQKNKPTPFNTVDFVFNHLLSNVNFYFGSVANFDFTGISSIEVKSFDVTDLYNKGTYTQTGWAATTNQAEGAWGNQSGTYDFPAVSTGSVAANSDVVTLANDLLLLPQTISGDARIKLTYVIKYADGTSSEFNKGVRLADIYGTLRSNGTKAKIDKWDPNFIYNYTLAVNPAASNVIAGDADYDGSLTDNDNDGEGDGDRNSSVVVDEDGNYWVDIDDDGAGDYPIVWEDIDGDGLEEGGVDMDGDGVMDNVDGDAINDNSDPNYDPLDDNPNNPDHHDPTMIDTDGDGEPDTPLRRPGDNNADETVDNGWLVDYDGTYTGEQTPTNKLGSIDKADATNPYNDPNSPYYQADNEDDFYFVDVNGDGVYDPISEYPVVWKDIDGDGLEEGIADVNRDGIANDNFDGENVGYKVDEDGVNNPDGMDVILVDKDGDGFAEMELERVPKSNGDTKNPVIEFTATIEDWNDAWDAPYEVN